MPTGLRGRLASSLFCLLVVGCGGGGPPPPPAPAVSPTPAPSPTPLPTPEAWSFPPVPSAEAGLETVTEGELRDTVFYLASEALGGRGSGEGGDLRAAEFVAARMGDSRLEPAGGGSYLRSFPVPRGSGFSANVLGYLPGTDPALAGEVIVVGAHLDHLGDDPRGYFPGADDNASGTAVVVEAAEALSRLRRRLPRTVVLVAFSGEELGLLGSRDYVSRPPFPLAQTVYMVNLDMLGHLADRRLYCYGAASSDALGGLVLELAARYPDLRPSLEGPSGGSDHVPFQSVGVPTVFLHTGVTATYHTIADTPDTLDYAGLTTIARATVELVWRVAHGVRRAAAVAPPAAVPGPWRDHGVAPFPVPWAPIELKDPPD